MASRNPLNQSQSATVDASGRAVVTVQPLRAFERWHVTRMTVSNTGTVLVPTARVYKGQVSVSGLVDGTFTGTMDTSDCDIRLESGEILVCVWEGLDVGTAGADVGSTCTFSVQGESEHGV